MEKIFLSVLRITLNVRQLTQPVRRGRGNGGQQNQGTTFHGEYFVFNERPLTLLKYNQTARYKYSN